MNVKNIFLSWDFIFALLLSSVLVFIFTPCLSNQFARDLYNIGISVLSIVFSVYFAALAIIISASDDDFVQFLEEEGDYTGIISTFKFTLLILFIALVYSIAMYAFTSYLISSNITTQPKWFIIFFGFMFLYGLFSVLNSTRDSIKYALYRSKYLQLKDKGKAN